MSNVSMKSSKGNNVFISGDNNVCASNNSQVSTGFFSFQFNGFSFFNLFRKKKEIIEIPKGVSIDEISMNGNNINITLSNGTVFCKKGSKVSSTDKEIIIG